MNSADLRNLSYAPSISRRDSTRSINGRMPNSLEMARDSSKRQIRHRLATVDNLEILNAPLRLPGAAGDQRSDVVTIPHAAVNQARCPVTEPWKSVEVKTGDRRNTVGVDGSSTAVQFQTLDPTKIGGKTGAPDDGVDTCPFQVQRVLDRSG